MESSSFPLLPSSSSNSNNNDDNDNDDFVHTNVVVPSIIKMQVDELMLNCFEYLDVVTLIQKAKPVCKHWQNLGTQAIDNKCIQKKKFQSNNELEEAVKKYSPGSIRNNNNDPCSPTDAEDTASTYGYPINKWDVSIVKDFSEIFLGKNHFNEPIGSWEVSNATTMAFMFFSAELFNQDISSWDVSNVTDMAFMFADANSFNQDLSFWDVSSVTDMSYMFYNCPIDNERKPVFN